MDYGHYELQKNIESEDHDSIEYRIQIIKLQAKIITFYFQIGLHLIIFITTICTKPAYPLGTFAVRTTITPLDKNITPINNKPYSSKYRINLKITNHELAHNTTLLTIFMIIHHLANIYKNIAYYIYYSKSK